MLTPAARKLSLTAHLTTSVGWLGAVAGFLALSIAGLTSRDAETVRGSYLAMNVIGSMVIVPLSLAALSTGLLLALGTRWGLFRYYWILVKFTLTVLAAIALMLHQFVAVAAAARRVSSAAPGTVPDVGRLGLQLVGDAGFAVVLLIVITTLGVFKPWGRTAYGRREERREPRLGTSAPAAEAKAALPRGLKLFFAVIAVLVALFVLVHLAGGGLGPHAH